MKLTGEPLKITHVAKKLLMIVFKLSSPKPNIMTWQWSAYIALKLDILVLLMKGKTNYFIDRRIIKIIMLLGLKMFWEIVLWIKQTLLCSFVKNALNKVSGQARNGCINYAVSSPRQQAQNNPFWEYNKLWLHCSTLISFRLGSITCFVQMSLNKEKNGLSISVKLFKLNDHNLVEKISWSR